MKMQLLGGQLWGEALHLPRDCIVFLVFACLAGCADDRLVVATDACAIDVPARESFVKLGSDWHIGGWAFDRSMGSVPKSIKVQVISADLAVVRAFPASRGTRRDDVAKAFGVPAAVESGFDARARLDGVPAGRYSIQVVQSDDRKILLCSNSHFVVVQS